MPERIDFLFVTWQRHAGRAEEIAAALGGEALHVFPRKRDGRTLPAVVRYAVSAASTVVGLATRRPRAVAVVNPPVVPGVITALYSRLSGAAFALDSHTSSFGVKGNRRAEVLLPVTRWLARRSAAVMVAADEWADTVEEWGARPLVVHEAPPAQLLLPPSPERDRVLFVNVFSDDEPVGEVLEAARSLPHVSFRITGDLARCPVAVHAAAPPNVQFTGFLDSDDYWREVESATVLLALTTERSSVMRAAYEAVYAGRSLVVSDWPVLRRTFPSAHHAANDAASLATAIAEALRAPASPQQLREAYQVQDARWTEQGTALRRALGLPGADGAVLRTPDGSAHS